MELTISFDPLHLLGLIFCGYLASLVGNVLGITVAAVFIPSLDGQRFFVIAGLLAAMGAMTLVKIVVATVAAVVAMFLCATIGSALVWTMGITAGLGFAFSLLNGLSARM